jgi:hypothetical protein
VNGLRSIARDCTFVSVTIEVNIKDLPLPPRGFSVLQSCLRVATMKPDRAPCITSPSTVSEALLYTCRLLEQPVSAEYCARHVDNFREESARKVLLKIANE